jgi:hypothetical protein
VTMQQTEEPRERARFCQPGQLPTS